MASLLHVNGAAPSAEADMLDDSDIEAELEVDQLDSDTDPEADATRSSTHKNGSSNRPGERIPGHTLLPAVRLENIIQADGVTGSMALSKEGLYVLSIATEEFIKRLIQAAHREASAHRRNQINYTDMAATTQQYQEFMMLADTIPAPIALADALMLRQDKERELVEDNPALAVPVSFPSAVPSPDSEPSASAPKTLKKSKTLQTNGKEKEKNGMPGSVNSNGKRKTKKGPQPEPELTYPNITTLPNEELQWPEYANSSNGHVEYSQNHYRNSRNGIPPVSVPPPLPLPPPLSALPNGHSVFPHSQPSQYTPEGGYDLQSIHSPPQDPDSRSQTPPYGAGGPSWPGQFTGPASGFLHGPAASYGHPAHNPGRTIYSQTNHPD